MFGVDLDCKCDEYGHAKELQDAVWNFLQSIFGLLTALPLYKVFPTSTYTRDLIKVWTKSMKLVTSMLVCIYLT